MSDGISLQRLIKISLLTDVGKSWPTFDGNTLTRWQYVTASEADKCVRQLAFEKIRDKSRVSIPNFWDNMSQEEFDAAVDNLSDSDSLGIFARGNNIEDWAVKQLVSMTGENEEFLCVGEGQRSFYTNKRRVSGTPDGIFVDHAAQTYQVLEFKSSQNPVAGPKGSHIAQLQVNMGLIQYLSADGLLDEMMDFPFSSYTMGPGLLLYINSDNYLTMSEFKVVFDSGEAFNRAFMKAKALFTRNPKEPDGGLGITPPAKLAPEGIEKPGGCFFCEFKDACADIERHKQNRSVAEKIANAGSRFTKKTGLPKMPDFRSFDREQVLAALARYQQAGDDEKLAKKVKEELKPLIVEWLKANGPFKKFQDGNDVFNASFSEFELAGKVDLDKVKAALEDAGFDFKDFLNPPTQSSRLTVKVVPSDAYLRRDLIAAINSEDESEDENE